MNTPYPLNPRYGSGVYRRKIHLVGRDGLVLAELEDCHHGFRLRLNHDGSRVTSIDADTLRYPMSTCHDAVGPLQKLIDHPLNDDASIDAAFGHARSNCTHLFDLARLAISHANRGFRERLYEVEIPDGSEGVTTLRVYRDSALIHQWEVRDDLIIAPQAMAGVPVMKGFLQQASQQLQGDDLEAAQVLQRGYFVSLSRRFDVDASAGAPATAEPMMLGACYSYSPGVVEHSHRNHTPTRDFSDCPEQLLQFR